MLFYEKLKTSLRKKNKQKIKMTFYEKLKSSYEKLKTSTREKNKFWEQVLEVLEYELNNMTIEEAESEYRA